VPEARMYVREQSPWRDAAALYEGWGESFARFYRRHMARPRARLPLHLAYLLAREALTGNAARTPAFLRGLARGFQKPLGSVPRLGQDFPGGGDAGSAILPAP